MKLQNYLKKMNVDGVLITDEYSLRYFTGFTGTTGIALALTDRKFFFTDFRYVEQANHQVKPMGFEIVKIEREAVDLIAEYIKNSGTKRLGIEDKNLTVFDYNIYKEKFEGVEFVPLKDTLVKERMIKSEEEIEITKKAVEITDKAFSYALETIKEGMTEKELAAAMEWFMKKEGGDGPSFETILASNERSAMPHGVASDKPINKEGFVKFDFGVYYKGYVSDMTRTIYFGENPSDKHKEVYSVVLEAQKKACEAVRAGITCKDLDKVARDYITEKGYGEYFGHGLGHGIGLYIHEHPFVNTKNDMVLEEGMIITIEPGIYLEGFGGVRIEDDVVVRKDHGEILNKSDKNLKIIYRK